MWIDRVYRTRDWPRVAAATLSLLVLGCSGTAVPTGTVSGKVIYQGKPAPEGCLVTFITDRGYAALGTVDANGQYKLMMAGSPDIPAEKYNVSVTYPGVPGPEMSEEDERKWMAGDPAMLEKFKSKKKVSIPEKYADSIKSGLTFDIKKGPNTYDIEMK